MFLFILSWCKNIQLHKVRKFISFMKNKFNWNFCVSSISANLALIAKPSACFKTSVVFKTGKYEKTLCHVKMDASYSQAKAYCMKMKMQLSKPKSSAEASVALAEFAKVVMRESSRASIFVDGMSKGKCLTINGVGKMKYDICKLSFNFICEYNDRGKNLRPFENLRHEMMCWSMKVCFLRKYEKKKFSKKSKEHYVGESSDDYNTGNDIWTQEILYRRVARENRGSFSSEILKTGKDFQRVLKHTWNLKIISFRQGC